MPPQVPTGARRYRVHEVLGRGGFGTVYRADLLGDGGFVRPVALKVLHPKVEARPGELARLRDEARILGLLDHRALVRVDALVHLEGRWTIVMELVRGAPLERVRRAVGTLPPSVVAAIGAEIALALHEAWHHDVDGRPLKLLHRDVKPSNVLLTASGEVKLLDFGVARAEFEAREAQTQSVVYGSPAYLSPERLELVDTAAGDVFALGISLAELLTGRMADPVVARPAKHEARVQALLHDLPADPLRALLTRMLAYEHEDRPSAEAVAAALAEVTGGPTLRAWAAEVVPGLVDHGEGPTGDLTGRTLAEDSGSAPAALGPLAGGDQGWEEPPEPTFAFGHTLAEAPTPRRGWGVGTWLAASAVTTSAVAVGVVALWSAACAGLVAWSWPGITREGCLSEVQEMEAHVARVAPRSGRYAGQAREITARTAKSCRSGDLGMVGGDLLLLEFQQTTADGALDGADLDDLLDTERRMYVLF